MPALTRVVAYVWRKLVRGDVERVAAPSSQPGVSDGGVEAVSELVCAESAASVHEQELGGPAVAGMGEGPLASPVGHPCVECGKRGGVEGDGALGAEFADRHLDPGAVRGGVPQAVELEVEQLAQAHSGAAQDGEAVAGEGVAESGDGGHEVTVDVGRERSG